MKIFQVPGTISKASSMSKNTLRIQFDTQENCSPEAMKRLFELIDQPGYMTVNSRPIEATDIVDLPPLRPMDNKKSPSERLRNVLFRVWELDNKGYEVFDNYYIYMMDQLCEHYKKQLN